MLRVHPCGCGHAAGHADPDVSCLPIQALTVEHFISSDEAMVRGSSIALILLFTVVSPATGETVNFESSAAILGESCGKDIDANCFGVNFDAPRLRECLSRNQDSLSPQCRTDYIKAFDAIQKRVAARAAVRKICDRDKQKFCAAAGGDWGDVLACLSKVPRGVTFGCKQAIGEAGYH